MVAQSFYDILTEAVNDIAEHGYDSEQRVAYWSQRIKEAAERTMRSPQVMEKMLRDAMAEIYRRLIDRGEIVKLHPGVPRFTIDRVKPHLRAELDRRIVASANLIKMNRQEAIDKTLRRLSGWATSIPAGGAAPGQKVEAKASIRKALAQLPFEERRVIIDQSHKLRSSLSEVLALDGNAIAGVWRSHYRQAGYNYRPDHKERDSKVYLIRGSWAQEAGLIKVGPAGYTDAITRPAEEPFCRCFYTYLYSLRDLEAAAPEMLTVKGRDELARVRTEIAKMRAA